MFQARAFSRVLMGVLFAFGCFAVSAPPAAAQGDQAWAKARVDNSRRHLEWVDVKHGDRTVKCFVAYPEVSGKAQAVIVIHEIFGLTEWVKSICDQLAEAGYIAIAPDFLSGMGPNGGGSAELGATVRNVIGQVPKPQITADLNAVAEYVTKLPAANGNLSVCGFCWGGTETFRYATNNKNLKAAYVFYGSGPTDPAEIARINCPVYGFYGQNDNRINATLDASKKLMADAKKIYEPVIYAGAGHGFMRSGEDPAGPAADKKGREDGWARWKELLKKTAGGEPASEKK
jgi:carboxymethylenebutenolidase